MPIWTSSARLTLRRWTDDHLSHLRELSARPEVVRHVGDGLPWSAELVSDKHTATLAHWREHGFGWLAVHVETFVGIIALTRRSEQESGIGRPAVELGYWTVPEVWGRGYAGEAAAAAVDAVFGRELAEDIVARYRPVNAASGRVLDRLGFVPHGVVQDGEGSLRVAALARSRWLAAGAR